MTIDDENLEVFARKCAAAYCRRFSNWSQLEDATQDAAVFLLANRDKWTKPAPVLFRRTVGQLVRNYQEERKLRTKTPIRIVSGDVDRATTKNETAEVDERLDSNGEPDPRWTIIERALRQRLEARPGVIPVDTKRIDPTPEERAANPLFFD